MKSIGIIIGLLYVAFHIISWAVNASAKRKERERMQELADRRRGGAGQSGRVTAVQTPANVRSQQPAPMVGPRSRAEELAERRKAQLEELRRRREQRQTSATTRLQAGGPTAPTTARPPAIVPPDPGGSSRRPDLQPWRSRTDAAAARRAAETQARKEEAQRKAQEQRRALMQRRREREQERRQEEQRARDLRSLAPLEQDDQPQTLRQTRSRSASAIRDRLGDRASLRQIFILKELIDPPLALRPSSD